MSAGANAQDEGEAQARLSLTLNFTRSNVRVSESGAISLSSMPSTLFDAKQDFGVIGDGSTDDTISLQNAINTSGIQRVPLVIPAGQYKITSSILIPSNVTILGYGARIDNYSRVASLGGAALSIASNTGTLIENIKIYGLEVNGRKTLQPNYQACLLIQGNVQNVLVKDAYLHDSSLDGWYTIESSASASYVPTRLAFEDVVCTGNKRQGASIVCGRFVTVKGGIYSGTGGNAPGAGIDIEPSIATSPCEHIAIDGVSFENNEGSGLLIDFAVEGTSPIRGVTITNCQMVANMESGISIRAGQDVLISDNVITGNLSSGISLDAYPMSPLQDIVIESCRISSNGHAGVFVVLDNPSSSAKSLKFNDLIVVDNGTSISNNYAGMQFEGLIDDVQVLGCTSQNRTTSNQAYGLITGAGVTRFRGDLNNFQGNATAAKVLGDDAATRKYGESNNES